MDQLNGQFRTKCEEFGLARLAVADRAKSPEDWQALWKDPAHPYLFRLGDCWKPCIEYYVDNYPAEIGFFLDIIGLDANVLSTDFSMLMNPQGEFFFSVKPAHHHASTPPGAFRLQFLLDNVQEAAAALVDRGIIFEKPLQPCEEGSPMLTGAFRTPHGIAIDLWGIEAAEQEAALTLDV